MSKTATRKKRGILKVVLLAPILVIVFIVGWSLYWVGDGKKPNTKQQQKTINTRAEQGNVELYTLSPQEQEVLAN